MPLLGNLISDRLQVLDLAEIERPCSVAALSCRSTHLDEVIGDQPRPEQAIESHFKPSDAPLTRQTPALSSRFAFSRGMRCNHEKSEQQLSPRPMSKAKPTHSRNAFSTATAQSAGPTNIEGALHVPRIDHPDLLPSLELQSSALSSVGP